MGQRKLIEMIYEKTSHKQKIFKVQVYKRKYNSINEYMLTQRNSIIRWIFFSIVPLPLYRSSGKWTANFRDASMFHLLWWITEALIEINLLLKLQSNFWSLMISEIIFPLYWTSLGTQIH